MFNEEGEILIFAIRSSLIFVHFKFVDKKKQILESGILLLNGLYPHFGLVKVATFCRHNSRTHFLQWKSNIVWEALPNTVVDVPTNVLHL